MMQQYEQPKSLDLLFKPMKTIRPNIEERAFLAMGFFFIKIKNNVGDNFRLTRRNTIKN